METRIQIWLLLLIISALFLLIGCKKKNDETTDPKNEVLYPIVFSNYHDGGMHYEYDNRLRIISERNDPSYTLGILYNYGDKQLYIRIYDGHGGESERFCLLNEQGYIVLEYLVGAKDTTYYSYSSDGYLVRWQRKNRDYSFDTAWTRREIIYAYSAGNCTTTTDKTHYANGVYAEWYTQRTHYANLTNTINIRFYGSRGWAFQLNGKLDRNPLKSIKGYDSVSTFDSISIDHWDVDDLGRLTAAYISWKGKVDFRY
jgi:hypothetical protein